MVQRTSEKASALDRATTIDRAWIVPVGNPGVVSYKVPYSTIVPELNVLAEGATGDGVTDDTTAIQSAITKACAIGGTVFFPQGVYKCTVSLTCTGAVTLRGVGPASVLDFSSVTGTFNGITAVGSIATGVSLTGNAVEGTKTLTVPSTGFADDDLVMVYSEAVTGSTNIKKGEICRIATASSMTLEDPLQDTYNTADTAKVAKITPVQNLSFRDLKILGPTDSSSTFAGINLDRTVNSSISNVTFEKTWFTGVSLNDSCFVDIQGCYFNQAGNAGLNYGVSILQASQDVTVNGCKAWQMRHGVTHGGSSSRYGIFRRSTTTGCVFSQCYQAGVDAHAGGEDVNVVGNVIEGSPNEGITIECASATVVGNTIRDAGLRAISVRTSSVKPLNVTITGNRVSGKSGVGCRGVLLEVNSGYDLFDAITITGNSFTDCRYGIEATNAAAARIENLTITGNTFTRCSQNGEAIISITKAQGVVVSGNSLYENVSSSDGVSLTDVVGGTVQANVIRLPNSGACRCIRMLTTTASIVVDGNFCSGGANSVGVDLASTVTNVTIGPGNNVVGCTSGFIMSTGTGHRIVQAPGVSADVGNAAKTIGFNDEPTQRWDTPITADRAVTLPAATVKMRWRIVRGASCTGAFNINVGTGPLKALGTAGTWCDVESDGTNYVLVGNGSL